MDLGLSGRTAAVAAASSGLGLAAATALAAEGVRVAMCSRDEARITAAAERVGAGAIPLVADVSTEAGAIGFLAGAGEALGRGPDILVTNAGGPPAGGFGDTELAAYRDALDLNLLSSVAMCRAAIPAMREAGWGRVVAITSATVKEPSPVLILSNTARAGLTGFLRTVATEVAADGVTVNSVLPGFHRTNRLLDLDADLDELAEGVPARRIGDPDDFGSVVAFLCSEPARYVTGVALQVDGGRSHGLF